MGPRFSTPNVYIFLRVLLILFSASVACLYCCFVPSLKFWSVGGDPAEVLIVYFFVKEKRNSSIFILIVSLAHLMKT
ncbi:hypothetical protein MtrunA17_Chr8g0354521 [Medicago truncatula]|uniref:Transmembrane protein n=1 Tax=Medicago truncatula TaxID=3880 RepID=A0A396GJ65_MEDTR|nr:hypothetical protein MtrunA17_Chr8g0354521 [Medicago truncatula]